jgi:LL-diaminopimelate aminotransferase
MKKSSRRLDSLPRYLFSELEKVRDNAERAGREILDLSIGDPDLPTPGPILEALERGAADPANHRYPTGWGTRTLRERAALWFKERFGVSLDPEREVLCLLGSKEGLAHLPLAVCDPGDVVLVPDPGYPVYRSASMLAGAKPVQVALKEADGFLLDLEAASDEFQQGLRLCYINYPHNPTGAAAGLDYFQKAVNIAAERGFLICSDAAYSEITYEGKRSPSILQAEGAKNVAVEFHSFSKTYNMTGWRIAFGVGDPDILNCLAKVKSNIDSGAFQAVQQAAVSAFDMAGEDLVERRRTYENRKVFVLSALEEMGCHVFPPAGAFYVWARVPGGYDSISFTSVLLERTGVAVSPGVGFGPSGEGYFRISLTAPEGQIKRAMERIGEQSFWTQ